MGTVPVPERIGRAAQRRPTAHHEIAKAVDDLGVLAKARLAVDVADGSIRHTIGLSELSLGPAFGNVA